MDNLQKKQLLQNLDFGQRIAEQESAELAKYFVQTDQWKQIFSGAVDIVYGPKGSGKSALYSSLVQHEGELFDKGIILIPAENPKGSPAFKDLVTSPPSSEDEFINLWKLYLTSLLAANLRQLVIKNHYATKLISVLEVAHLLPRDATLAGRLKAVYDYVQQISRPEAIEGGLIIDPTGMPTGVTGKITFKEPTTKQHGLGFMSVDELLDLADKAFKHEDIKAWLILDRLDVAFADSPLLETNALRALFKVYLDMQHFSNIYLKIFLRDDIWRRITQSGFREASHITKTITISWNSGTLLNLIVRRLMKNANLIQALGINELQVLENIELQQNVFYSIFPDQVDAGEKKPTSFDWIVTRTKDGSSVIAAPREVIHLLSQARAEQLSRIEVGNYDASSRYLISGPALKDALPEVSRVRYEQTLLAEHPDLKTRLEAFRGQKTQHSALTLAQLWETPSKDIATVWANELTEIGFFLREGKSPEWSYWVPFLYRSALDMVQGAAE